MTNRTSGDRPSALARLWLPENDRNIPTSRTRAFLGRHLWLLCVIAVIVGFAAGLLSGLFVFKWNEWNSPSFGAFIAPAAVLGWAALRSRQAALLGLLTLLATTGGHFFGAQFSVYEQNPLEYRGWIAIALFLGPLLGCLGHTLRSRRLLVRAVCAGVLIAWLCVPFTSASTDRSTTWRTPLP